MALSSLPARLLAGIALSGISVAAHAQDAQPAGEQQATAPSDIIVTATRRNERLQDVPVTVTAVTNEQLQDLNITQFRDVQVLSPGLVIEDRGAQGNVTALRGISTTVNSGSPQAVIIYFNEAPIQDTLAFQSIYDIGQIEVLRGPQGTLRGVAAPAGSITITTRRPDLNNFGATIDGTFTDQTNINGQFGIGVPLINDVLAVRVAGLYDRNTNGDIRSLNSDAKSRSETKSIRASALFHPIEPLTIFGSYQYLRNETDNLTIVEGNGRGYNGPVLPEGSGRRGISVQEETSPRRVTGHLASLSAKLDIGDEAALSYIGGYSKYSALTRADEGDGDSGNAIPNFSQHALFDVSVTDWSHELRLDSQGPGRFWDYTVGAFFRRTTSNTNVAQQVFGVPSFTPTFDPIGPVDTFGFIRAQSQGKLKDKSVFASSTFHLPTKTDITLGARRLWSKNNAPTSLTFVTSVFGTEFPGTPSIIPDTVDEKAWVYDAKIVQHIGEDSIVYASYGRGFRGPGNNKYVALPASFPRVTSEKQDSYELGFKGSFLDRRLRVDFAVFQQDIKGFITTVADVPYCSFGNDAPCPPVGSPPQNRVTSSSIAFNGDARVRGFDLDISGKITDRWTAQGTVSYAKANFKNAQVPCRPDLDGDGQPDTDDEFGANATQPIYFCSSNGAIADVPKWNFTLQSEYTVPLAQAEAFVRALFVYKGKRAEVSGLNSYEAQPILNLYLGAREIVPGLEVTMFAKNIFNTRKLTYTSSDLVTFGFPSGYHQVTYTPQREVGITARMRFGSD